jgi:transcription initiation factor TFIID/TFIIF subunit
LVAFKKPPFKLEEKGWGEFDMSIVLTYAEKNGTKTIAHDLHFQAPKYEVTHVLVPTLPKLTFNPGVQEFTKPSQSLLKILSESGEAPGYSPPAPPAPPAPVKVATPQPPPVEETKKRKSEAADDTRQTKKVSKGVKDWTGRPADMDRLAQGLQKLGEDDLLQIVKMVNENKTADMYVKNDLEGTAHFPILRPLLFGVNG